MPRQILGVPAAHIPRASASVVPQSDGILSKVAPAPRAFSEVWRRLVSLFVTCRMVAYPFMPRGGAAEINSNSRIRRLFPLNSLGADRIPDPTTAGDFCRRFRLDHIEALHEAFDAGRKKVWASQPEEFFEEACLDADGILVPKFVETLPEKWTTRRSWLAKPHRRERPQKSSGDIPRRTDVRMAGSSSASNASPAVHDPHTTRPDAGCGFQKPK